MVDNLIFVMSTPEHGECAGFDGGCPVCAEYYGRALKVQEMWREKARRLGIPLSDKRHAVSQWGAFAGVGIDTLRGIFFMLEDKLRSMLSAVAELAAAESATPRLIAMVRGKALHCCRLRATTSSGENRVPGSPSAGLRPGLLLRPGE